jgi:hypothetical protein
MKTQITTILLVLAMVAWVTTAAISAEEALTVGLLEKRNLKPLDDKALKELIVGKTLVVRNRTTGELHEATYYQNGQRVLRRMTQQQLQQSAAYAFHGGITPAGVAPYEIRNGQVITTFDGKTFKATVYKFEGKYVASHSAEGGAVNWEVVESGTTNADKKTMTEFVLMQQGIDPLDDNALKELIVGKTLVIRNHTTGELYEATYSADGKRHVRNITKGRLRYLAFQAFHGGFVPEGIAAYEIRNGQVITTFDGKTFKAKVYNVYGTYVAARSGEGGAVNWEVIERR